MKQHRSWVPRARWSAVIAVVVLAGVAGTALAATSHRTHATKYPGEKIARELAKTKAALDRFRSVDAAKAAGYVAASPCASTPIDKNQTSYGGGMGIHYMNMAFMAPGAPMVATKPPILVYAPKTGGGLELVAAEYFKLDADQNVKTDGDRPSIFGRAFDGPMLGHAPGMPIHYDLHVWLWKHNPSGMFASWNPDVTCP
jgi:hypothetical protein